MSFGTCTGGAIANLSAADFQAKYPAFSGLTPEQVEALFGVAVIFLRNDGTGPVCVVSIQTNLLYMLTAHLAQLQYGADGKSGGSMVGRVSSASEGSVSVGLEYGSTPNAAWYNQTQYGATFWQATVAYRMVAGYRPGPTRFGTGIGAGVYPRGGNRGY